jgi:hypothetical protein
MQRLFALAALAAALVVVPAAAGDASFTDPPGDAGGAPDIVDVVVYNDAFTRVGFGVKIAGGKALGGEGGLLVLFDSDRNMATGRNGWDYLVLLTGDETWDVSSWDGTQWVEAPAASAKAYFQEDVLLFGIDRAELGNTAGFDFFVTSLQFEGDQLVASDTAPDGEDVWTYATVRKTFGLGSSQVVSTTKGGARAGKAFVAGYVFGRLDSPEPATGAKTTCVATVAGKRIAARVSSSAEAAACRVTLPAASKGKVLKLTLTTTLRGKSVQKSYATKVKA